MSPIVWFVIAVLAWLLALSKNVGCILRAGGLLVGLIATGALILIKAVNA